MVTIRQSSHKLWKSGKTWKITKKSSLLGKIIEFEKTWLFMDKSWNFVKYLTKPPVARKLAVRHTSVRQLVFWLLVVSSFNYFNMHAWSIYKYAVDAAFRILLSLVKMLLKGEVRGGALNSHGNYIVDHRKPWNCVFEFLWEPWLGQKKHWPNLNLIERGFTGINMWSFSGEVRTACDIQVVVKGWAREAQHFMEVGKKAKIWNWYNEVPNLTQDTIWESDKNTRKHHTQGSQEVSPFQAGNHKAVRNRQGSRIKTYMKHK